MYIYIYIYTYNYTSIYLYLSIYLLAGGLGATNSPTALGADVHGVCVCVCCSIIYYNIVTIVSVTSYYVILHHIMSYHIVL